jgi:hypothetical protein
MSDRSAGPSFSLVVASWGVLGVALLLTQAVVRLAPVALEPIRLGALSTFQALVYAAWVGVSLYSEGYRGFQKAFVPRTVARAFYLARSKPSWLSFVAPLFCMGLVHARPRRLVTSWAVVTLITCAVIAVRRLPAPWRGVVDGGVVVGLLYGLITLLVVFTRALRGSVPSHPLDLPG